ncbi:DUF2798 domain-containing protein [Elioraea sp.]|uniref:DUF2798 domain-containing protein n=1 Tax=Elioraea sp. TaxID=2185103 RepID=UPI0025C5F4E2|nr:DUF2798 domain-containing protein [Elioraea sp.]
MRLPGRYAPILFGFLLSGMMSFLVSGISTFKALGVAPDFMAAWLSAWGFAWPVAFASVLVVAPFVRRIVSRVTEPAR